MKGTFQKNFCKQVAVCLMAAGLVALAGCGSAESGENGIGRDPQNPPVYAATETFRTAAWSLPPNADTGAPDTVLEHNPNYATTENWQTMADCGFRYAMPTSDYNDDHIRNTLEKAQAVGMKVLVRDYNSRGVQYTIGLGGTYA
ncbi:MAG: hypothetical protein K2H43_02595, partial [Clostridia bacterium]|nr:hypothetical protein [Clostridia bacterium]